LRHYHSNLQISAESVTDSVGYLDRISDAAIPIFDRREGMEEQARLLRQDETSGEDAIDEIRPIARPNVEQGGSTKKETRNGISCRRNLLRGGLGFCVRFCVIWRIRQ
jgi:hypothetical protein